jgi:hypothetical protein
MAVENDYNLLVHNLNELAKTISELRDEVERRLLTEAEGRLEPNQTDWVNLIGLQLRTTSSMGCKPASRAFCKADRARPSSAPSRRPLPMTRFRSDVFAPRGGGVSARRLQRNRRRAAT